MQSLTKSQNKANLCAVRHEKRSPGIHKSSNLWYLATTKWNNSETKHNQVCVCGWGGHRLTDLFDYSKTQPCFNRFNIKSAWFPQNSPEEPESEPVHEFYDRYEADSEAKSTDATQAWDEVQPGHPSRPLKLWRIVNENKSVNYDWNTISSPKTVEPPKKMFTTAMSFS